MTIQAIIDSGKFTTLVKGASDRSITKIFCCDLLSIAMGKAPADSAWITVMGNRNTLAVASLADVACVILAEGVAMNEQDLAQASEEGIAVLKTDLPIFEAALEVHKLL